MARFDGPAFHNPWFGIILAAAGSFAFVVTILISGSFSIALGTTVGLVGFMSVSVGAQQMQNELRRKRLGEGGPPSFPRR